MKVIFLDIDGVLNAGPMHKGYWDNPTQTTLVERLKKIVEATGASVVWSTSWRTELPFKTLDKFMHLSGFPEFSSIDQTPDLQPVPTMYNSGVTPRRDEIKTWLSKHPEVEKHVVLDDDPDACLYKTTFCRCNPKVGLSEDGMNRAIRILNSQEES